MESRYFKISYFQDIFGQKRYISFFMLLYSLEVYLSTSASLCGKSWQVLLLRIGHGLTQRVSGA